MKLSRTKGGCWFCQEHNDGDKYEFSYEFDANFHIDCLKKELKQHPENPEVRIMASEFGIK